MLTNYSSPLVLFQFGGEVNQIKRANHLPVWDQLFWPASALLIVRLGTGLKTFKSDTAVVQPWTPALKVAHYATCSARDGGSEEEGWAILKLYLKIYHLGYEGRTATH